MNNSKEKSTELNWKRWSHNAWDCERTLIGEYSTIILSADDHLGNKKYCLGVLRVKNGVTEIHPDDANIINEEEAIKLDKLCNFDGY